METNRSAPAAARVRRVRKTMFPLSPIMRTAKPFFSRNFFVSSARFKLNSNSGIPLAEITPGSPWKWPTSTATRAGRRARRLEPREIRLALLEERRQGFLGLGRGQPLGEDLRFLADGLAKRGAVALLHQLLGETDRLGRQRRQRLGRLLRLQQQLVLGNDVGNQADVLRLF